MLRCSYLLIRPQTKAGFTCAKAPYAEGCNSHREILNDCTFELCVVCEIEQWSMCRG